MKTRLIRPFAQYMHRRVKRWAERPHDAQQRVFEQLIRHGSKTHFGRDHQFEKIRKVADFQNRVPLRDYEGLKAYADRVAQGENDVLWPGRPAYLAKTSGTTSGVKYIPITRASLPNHMHSARNAIFTYIARHPASRLFDGKLIFLSGSPALESTAGIPTGRLSGIVNHEIPAWAKNNQLPSFGTNCIEDWEEKLDAIVSETINADLRLISGIPPWVQMYFERLIAKTGRSSVGDIFPNLELFIHGGVNYKPYAPILQNLIGRPIATLETYPASEGFIAFQDGPEDAGLLLNVYSGIFFEFVPAHQAHEPSPPRLTLRDIELDTDYAIIINNNAGLWAYSIGDLVRFVSKAPYRLVVSGRIKHFISAFGEHVIGKEVEEAMQRVTQALGLRVAEFTVAPQVQPSDGEAPYHEWFVEFDEMVANAPHIAAALDEAMTEQNIYYKDLIDGKVLRPLVLRPLRTDAFRDYMRSIGKLGGQNKVPRLSNNRDIADALTPYLQSIPS